MKQCIIVRKDLKMPPGKLAVQTAHASVEAALNSDSKKIKEWRKEGMKKIILKVDSLKELNEIRRKATSLGIKTALIKDAGKTFFKRATVTCLGLGPDSDNEIDKAAEHLKML